MSDDKKKGRDHGPTIEKHKKARAARIARALAKGKKAGRKSEPTHPAWEGPGRKRAKQRTAHAKQLHRLISSPACVLKSFNIRDDIPETAADRLRAAAREAAMAEAAPEAKAERPSRKAKSS